MLNINYFILFLTIITLTNGSSFKAGPNKLQSISSGLSFGFCRGYCQRSIQIDSNKLELVAEKRPNFEQKDFPAVEKRFQFTGDQWQSLTSMVDFDLFNSLDDRIGCPDCADGGAEWVQIDTTNGLTKRITFENGATIPNLNELIDELRRIREKFINQL